MSDDTVMSTEDLRMVIAAAEAQLDSLAPGESIFDGDDYDDYTWHDVYEQEEDHYSWQAVISLASEENHQAILSALSKREYRVDASFFHFNGSVTIETFSCADTRAKDEVLSNVAAIVEPLGGAVHMRGVA